MPPEVPHITREPGLAQESGFLFGLRLLRPADTAYPQPDNIPEAASPFGQDAGKDKAGTGRHGGGRARHGRRLRAAKGRRGPDMHEPLGRQAIPS